MSATGLFYCVKPLLAEGEYAREISEAIDKAEIRGLEHSHYEVLKTPSIEVTFKSLQGQGITRLIAVDATKDGVSIRLIVDYLPEHEYNECRYLREKYTKDEINKLAETAVPVGKAAQLQDEAGPSNVVDVEEPVRMVKLSQYQQEAAQLARGKARLVIGHAGTGKTTVAAESIRLALEALSGAGGDEPQQFLYVAPTKRLADKMSKLVKTYRAKYELSENQVIVTCQSVEDLLDIPGKEHKERKDYAYFVEYAKQHWRSYLGFKGDWKALRDKQKKQSLKLIRQLYEEFRLISGLSKDVYVELRPGATFFKNDSNEPLNRSVLFGLYEV